MIVVKWISRNTFVNFGHELEAQLQTLKVQLALWSCLKLCSPYPPHPLTLESPWHEIPEFGRQDRFLLLSTFLFVRIYVRQAAQVRRRRQCFVLLALPACYYWLAGRGEGEGEGGEGGANRSPGIRSSLQADSEKGNLWASMQSWSNKNHQVSLYNIADTSLGRFKISKNCTRKDKNWILDNFLFNQNWLCISLKFILPDKVILHKIIRCIPFSKLFPCLPIRYKKCTHH